MSRIFPLWPVAPDVGDGIALRHPPPLSLYVHFPWCVRKCPYCDFNSHAVKAEGIPEEAYIDALIADLTAALPQVWGRRVISVFIGGGTPSLLSAAGLDRLLTQVRMLLPLDPLAEITLEANPGTLEHAHFGALRAAGVTRLSLGIQSFDDAHLQALGRIHGGREAREAVASALQHFERVNLDLMYALPGQRLEQALHDVATAVAYAPAHLSCYHLTLEPNTPFAAAPPDLPDDDLAADMQEAIEAQLAGAGYVNYETSAFARAGAECLHNLNYWSFGDYLGIGAGAHGKLSSHTGIVREVRHRHPKAYLAAAAEGQFVAERRAVGVSDLPFEFMMNALRLHGGFPQALYAERTGLPWTSVDAPLRAALAEGLMCCENGWWKPTPHGRRFLNTLLQRFLPEN